MMRTPGGRFIPFAAALLIPSIVFMASPVAAEDRPLPIRNHNPFLQVFGLPAFDTAIQQDTGSTRTLISFDIANHADADVAAGTQASVDGETTFLTLDWRYGWGERIELGIAIPFVSHNDGFLDSAIETWHDWFGLSNANRSGPRDQLRYAYGSPLGSYLLSSSASGIGDIRLNGALRLGSSTQGSTLALRAGLKLPTGDERDLLGSGGTDLSLALYGTNPTLFGRTDLSGSAFGGVLLTGKAEIDPGNQNDYVGFAGASVTWQLTRGLALNAQLYGQSAYYDSPLDVIGGNSIQFAAGGSYLLQGDRVLLSAGIVEDLFTDATTDVAFQFNIRITSGN